MYCVSTIENLYRNPRAEDPRLPRRYQNADSAGALSLREQNHAGQLHDADSVERYPYEGKQCQSITQLGQRGSAIPTKTKQC